MTARIGLVVNPTAGKGRGTTAGPDAHARLRALGLDVEDLSGPSLAQATDRARAAAVAGLDAVVVVGGDGMVHLGANVVAGTDVPLGIIAAGTGNDVARTLGLPRGDVAASVEAIGRALAGTPRRVDAVRVGPPGTSAREWYVGVLSCGLDAAVNARANGYTWPRGESRYVRALVAEVGRYRPFGYRVTYDGTVWESGSPIVAVANCGWFGGGVNIAPQARVDDGLLDIVVAAPLARPGVLKILPRVYRGTHTADPAVRVLQARSVLVEPLTALGAAPPPAFADGERAGPLPLQLDVVPGALRVLA
ncbi:diacylglycerol/lipid kinase family protein [Cellulomonas palmilytica]|uniref:diacylglycerol/lipid kinase family protein n=1 Tax=Cellulomonas palmilytica TaxID=2608402 RepID=UPI001F1B3C04|nr:diacylglycerol kinase family protein [Cellulomonas palmilytica]UJP38978.1 diacylglycerol kinase family lipid kinase [Cellulomonas palmilytica]